MNMKTTVFAILAALGAANAVGAADAFKDDKEKVSYAAGLNYGSSLKRQEIELDPDQFAKGFKDAQSGAPLLTEQETREVLTKYQQELTAKRQEKQRQLGEKNKKEGEAFLAENKAKPGIITRTNGLQYKVVVEGSGDIPKTTDTVTVEYRGTLIDGTEFDSSKKAGKPYTTPVTRVVRGWTEALTQMKVGSKWQLFIPPDLAYGERGSGPLIGPNATLLFDVELVSIQPPPPPAAPAQPLTSDIIKVPSLEEMKKGAKIETIKAEDVEKLQKQQQQEKKNPK